MASLNAKLFVAFLALNMFSSFYDLMGIPVPLDRVAFALLVLSVASGSALRTAHKKWDAIYGLLTFQILLALTSGIVVGSLFTKYGAIALLDRIVVPSLCFMIAPACFRSAADRKVLTRFLVVIAIYLGLTSIFQVLGPQALVFPRYILDPSVGILPDRARGPFAEAAANGLVMTIATCACLMALSQEVLRRWRILAGLGAVACSIGVLLTYTRSAWLAFIFASFVWCILQREYRKFLLPSALALAAGIYALQLVPGVGDVLAARLTTSRSIDDRVITNDTALRLFVDSPLTGIGWARFLPSVVDNVRQLDLVPLTNVNIEVHNVLLSRLAELGFFGGAAWVAILILGPLRAVTSRAATGDLIGFRYLLAGSVVAYVYVALLTPLPYPFPSNLLFALGAIVLVGAKQSQFVAPLSGVELLRT